MRASMVLMTYNQEAFVAEAVKGALEQECEPIDILISDDGSPDQTFEIARQVVADYCGPHRVRLNRNERNLGIAAHINRCMGLIDSEIVVAAAGDDISMPQRVSRVLDAFRATNALLVHSRVRAIGLDGGDIEGPFTHDNALFFRSTSAVAAAHSMALYVGATGAWHREVFDRYGILRLPELYEDLIMGFRAALEDRVAFVDEALVRYRVGSGISNKPPHAATFEDWRAERLKTLRRNRAVLEQRTLDARMCDAAAVRTVLDALATATTMNDLRIQSYDQPKTPFLFKNVGRLHLALRTLISERKRLRRAMLRARFSDLHQ